MNDIIFNDLVKKHFSFLEQHSFKITRESDPKMPPKTDGFVEYRSDNTVIMIDSDKGSATVWLYRIVDGKKFYLTPVDFHEYLNTNEKEKAILLSTNPKNQHAVSELFNQKFLLNQPGWKSEGAVQEKLELRLNNYADWLRENASFCLLGDFSQWPKFYEYKIRRARADYLRRGQDEMVYAEIKDANGNYQLVKQPMFKDKLEHVEKLKKEFLG